MADIIIQEAVGHYLVSTVKLPFDHGINRLPLWYETMVFPQNSCSEIYMARYTTEEEAKAGHLQAVAFALTKEEDDHESNGI